MRPGRPRDRVIERLFARGIALSGEAADSLGRDDPLRAELQAHELRAVLRRLGRLLARRPEPLSGHVGALQRYTARRLGDGEVDARTLQQVAADLGVLREARRALAAHGAAGSGGEGAPTD